MNIDITNSYNDLKKRYSNDKLIEQVAFRREHLNSDKISIGKRGNITHILKQTHQTYYLGDFNATCMLAGTLLEGVLSLKLEQHLLSGNKVYVRSKKHGKYLADKPEDIEDLNFSSLITLCGQCGFLDKTTKDYSHDIRKIRNETTHNKMPYFNKDNNSGNMIMKIKQAGVIIEFPAKEVEELLDKQGNKPITAYYCLKRTREILHQLFKKT